MSTISLSSPAMSDKTLLLSVEDLISIAMGPHDRNTVNFKLIQTVLHILARQMRLLEQKVVLVTGELPGRGRTSSRGGGRDDELYRQRTPPEFETEEEKRRSSDRPRRRSRIRSVGEDGRDGGGAPRGKSRARDQDGDDKGGRGISGGRGGQGRDDDDQGGRGRSGGRGGQGRDDDDRGGRGKSGGRGQDGYDDDERGRGRPGRQGGQTDDDREGRGRSGGRGGHDDDVRGRQSRAGGHGGRDDDREGQGRVGAGGYDRDGDDKRGGGGGGAGGREEYHDDDREGRGRSDERGRQSRAGGRGGRDDDDERGGRDRAGGRGGRDDDEERGRGGGAGGGGGRDRDDDRGGRGGYDRDDDGRGGHDRAGGRGGHDDDERGGRGAERRDQEERGQAAGRGRGGRGSFDDDQGRGGPGRGYDEAGKQGIGVRVTDGPGKEKLLVVEKGPATDRGTRDRDSIAVVTQSQFQILEDQVEELWRAAGPLPPLKMPDNKQLREELAAGASLTDAMQAMQVSARVQAAEQAITKLGGLLTQLAASGALPEDAADAVMAGGWMDEDETSQIKSYKSLRVDPSPKGGIPGQAGTLGGPLQGPTSSRTAVSSTAYITKPEMGSALVKLRDEVMKNLNSQIEHAAAAAANAESTAHAVGEKLEELLKMDSRLSNMYSLVDDYSHQLEGFDAGLNTQMESFKEQMTTMRADLEEGLRQLDAGNSNPETAAVMELKERFEGLVRGLDDTMLQNTALTNMQIDLTQELKTLMEAVEMLREEKADRDELLDILRDKADVTMLDGLVRQAEFDRAQEDLEQRLDKCNDKFKSQDDVWMMAMKDLKELADSKAQMAELMKVRDEATTQLRDIDDRIDQLSLILGEPKAAVLMRKLARDAVCAACMTPALMDPGTAPPARRQPAPRGPQVEQPCGPEPKAPDYPDFRTHRCHRWVGGSHTLLPSVRAHPTPLVLPDVTRKYTGYGNDGRLYHLESEMEPCVECNPEPLPSPVPAPPTTARTDGGGDICDC